MEGYEYDSHRVVIEGGFSEPTPGNLPTVTVDPSVPLSIDAKSLREEWSGPSMTIMRLTGPNVEGLMAALARADGALQESHKVVRALHYYFDGSPDDYWRYLQREFKLLADRVPRHVAAMHGSAHHLWQSWLLPFTAGPWTLGVETEALQATIDFHIKAMEIDKYGKTLKLFEKQGKLEEIDRLLFGATRTLVDAAPAWRSGAIRLALDPSMEPALDSLILQQDEFPRLRDAYQQTFEAVCKALWLIVLAVNAAKRGDPEDFSTIHYTDSGKIKKVSSLSTFNRLSNANKLNVIREIDPFRVLLDPLNNRVRNAIGHASSRHDLISGQILNDRGGRERYFDFVAKVYRLMLPLQMSVCLLRGSRVLSSTIED
ncbi:hypothetical protein [Parafrankia sp. BMG5.11]|uniref:hypothetical protein n=1 Tax=Parafrankia sp. BMG5.11 TaxID=222540 RepID=UPI0010EC36CE|nr:hypothetical protein [Parafrankia sp. BMG5.11]TCJ34591.1 hypothetical protein E0504_31790 [Parafrankia sp. BMG5.11]